jgi:hypothetical protein
VRGLLFTLEPLLQLGPDLIVWVLGLLVGVFVLIRGRRIAGALLVAGSAVELLRVGFALLVWIGGLAGAVPLGVGGVADTVGAIVGAVGWLLVVPAVFVGREPADALPD